tara:strand:- start:1132 stop:1560 length:429 start_codon:yes stop_codon:yes gene_type:complete
MDKKPFIVAGQNARSPINVMPDGKQYVEMELPNEQVVPVFGDWETYGDPTMDENRNRIIADNDFIIYSLGDGTYALDAQAMEDKMVNPEQYDRGDREAMMAAGLKGGPGESRMGDLMEMLNSMRGQGGTPAPANRGMRPMRR